MLQPCLHKGLTHTSKPSHCNNPLNKAIVISTWSLTKVALSFNPTIVVNTNHDSSDIINSLIKKSYYFQYYINLCTKIERRLQSTIHYIYWDNFMLLTEWYVYWTSEINSLHCRKWCIWCYSGTKFVPSLCVLVMVIILFSSFVSVSFPSVFFSSDS